MHTLPLIYVSRQSSERQLFISFYVFLLFAPPYSNQFSSLILPSSNVSMSKLFSKILLSPFPPIHILHTFRYLKPHLLYSLIRFLNMYSRKALCWPTTTWSRNVSHISVVVKMWIATHMRLFEVVLQAPEKCDQVFFRSFIVLLRIWQQGTKINK